MKYKFKTQPYEHQLRTFESSCLTETFAIFWEQGTGKTKLVLDTAAYLAQINKIDCLFVVAPNGVHTNWVGKEIKTHLPDELMKKTRSFVYHASKATNKSTKVDVVSTLKAKFAVITMSYDAFITDKGRKFAKNVLTKRNCLYVLDESARIKNPRAKRTRAILASAKYATYRRILTGTPVANSPFDVYAQILFLDPMFWKNRGLINYTMFKNYFAVFVKQTLGDGRSFPKLVEYQNLDELSEMVASISNRVLKEDVLDLPPKVYDRRNYLLSAKQKAVYKSLKKDFMAEISEGEVVTADLAITRLLRMQQVLCGFVPTESYSTDVDGNMTVTEQLRDIDATGNTRIKALMDAIADISHKVIIWARFTRDVDSICEALGDRCVRYDGQTTTQGRVDALELFEGPAQFFVAKTSCAGEGLTLTQAKTVIYYSNTFVLSDRLQSEDRCHRIGQDVSVLYIDICAEGTVDERIIESLLAKKSIADQITGDKAKEWM